MLLAATQVLSLDTQPGWKKVTLPELPVPPRRCGLNHTFKPAEETFELYVPRTYVASRPCGVLAWISPTDEAKIPRQFEPLLDEFRLLAVTAARCGNKQPVGRREGLPMGAVLGLSKSFEIDRGRCVLSGLSGGGRIAALGCFVHPEFWRGAISWCGGNFYKNYPDLAKGPKYYCYGINHYSPGLVTQAMMEGARSSCRFAQITGPKDMNLPDCRDIDAALAKENFQHLLIEEPGLGHAVGSSESLRRALEFVLGPPPRP